MEKRGQAPFSRFARNSTVSYDEAINDPNWTKLSESESIFHDNGVGKPELKFIHTNGSEAVFDGDSLTIVTDPKYIGTYNYVNPRPFSSVNGFVDFLDYAASAVGHGAVDVLPYLIGGNVRGDN